MQTKDSALTFSRNTVDMDVKYIHAYLTKSYWSEGISLEKVQKCVDNSLNFGIFLNGKQVGYARVLTDFVRFAYLMDVFIDPDFQGKGFGKKLMSYVLEDDDIRSIPGMMLATKDAHTLYEQFGFQRFTIENSQRFMILKRKI